MRMLGRMLVVIAIGAGSDLARGQDVQKLLSQLPRNLQLRQERPRTYRFACDYLYTNLLGNPLWKEHVSAEYTRESSGGTVRWRNARIARAKGFDEPFPEGEVQPYMEGSSTVSQARRTY